MRSLWTGSIALGLVNIPVKLFSAIRERALDFDMLDRKDLSHIKFKRVNEKTGKEVPWNNIVKGYEIKDKYVVLTDEDFESASPEKTKTIDLEHFVKLSEIDVILFDGAYYLYPAKGGERAFNLLQETLEKSQRAGVGTFVLRNKEKPVVVRAAQRLLILHTLRFANEIRDPSEFEVKKTTSPKKELTMAKSLVEQMSDGFNIGDFKDTYTAKLMKRIRAKAAGKKLAVPKAVSSAPVNDLFEQLQKSLAKPKSGGKKK